MPSIDKGIMQLETSYIAGGSIKYYNDVKKNLAVPYKVKHTLTILCNNFNHW